MEIESKKVLKEKRNNIRKLHQLKESNTFINNIYPT